MAEGTPWWSRDSESKDDVNEDGKSVDDNGGDEEGDEEEEEEDMAGDNDGPETGGIKRRFESRLHAPEKSNL